MRIRDELGGRPGALPITMATCVACGDAVAEWITVVWQREQGLPAGEVHVVEAECIRTWCVRCGSAVEPMVRCAVIEAPMRGAS